MVTDVVTRDHVESTVFSGILEGGEEVNGMAAVSYVKWGVERYSLVQEDRRHFVRIRLLK